jgi:two-component system, NarL family, nitrate/nitrite response regulator NarL
MIDAPPRRVRVLLVDDHALVRTGLHMLIDSDPGCMVVGEAGDRQQAMATATVADPDVIVLDLDLAGDLATEFIEDLQSCARSSRVLVLTALRDTDLHREAIRLGARGVLLKDQAAGSLLKAIHKVHEGEFWLDRVLTAQLITTLARGDSGKPVDPAQQKIGSVTPRERQVISLVAAGCRNRDIANQLFISETTVRHHLTAIFSKLEVPDRLSLALFAFRHGLAPPPR